MVAYEGSEPFVFVSYSHKDKNKVLPLVEGLQNWGFRVWYDKRGISAGSEWPEVIAEHLENCSCMVAFVSHNFGDSNNCREELNFAKELGKTILVVYLEERKNLRASVRMRLGTLHSLNLGDYAGNDAFLNEISQEDALLSCLGTAAEHMNTPVSAGTFAAENLAGLTSEDLYKMAEAFGKEDHKKAVLLYKIAAGRGYAPAQHSLGFCYERGKGVTQDYGEAVKWYSKAADQGHAMAQNNIGYFNQHGLGMPPNYEEAIKWYHKAIKQGCASAQNNLGTCYQRGEGVPKNFKEAVNWYYTAAEQGFALAQTNLGYCYAKGMGVPQDYLEAVNWCRKAAEQGEVNAQYFLGFCYESGRGVREDKTEARKWYQKAADQGDEEAKKKLEEL